MRTARWWMLALLGACSMAYAQYKYVGPDGTVTYSDQPPPPSVKDVEIRNFTTGGQVLSLPFEVRQAVQRYPVTLYTTPNCPGCDDGRKYLRTRGVPYSEKVVSTAEELEALRKLSNQSNFPVLTVGRQKLIAFDSGTWSSILDDAGYPARSVLPSNYQNPGPEQMIPSAHEGDQTANALPPPSAPPAPAGEAPPGFKF
jgi:glutaredoxin